MVELEINGKKVQVPDGSMVMEAAQELGLYVPHFCFHKKLSIAANCRMCLVEIEKVGKPLPACATPVNQGMKVFTNSKKAKKAQQGVMEFLLINHPLDCPICDQGGECQLQDLAVGYGGSNSRFNEEKRVVFHKNMGPLISAEEMSRCIHCTRCVRFGQEVAGVMELGMPGRGEHSEITTFLDGAVESELSGNMIDICPVGALTSKPFRYSARTWELERFKTISPHDGMGTNIIAQVNSGKVARVVPFENEQINECWISDRDRFSYSALNSDDRLHEPMVKDKLGNWKVVDWQEALEKTVHIIQRGKSLGKYGVRGLSSPLCSTEELLLFQKLIKHCGSDSVDFRGWLSDKTFDHNVFGMPNLGMKISEISDLDSVFLIGSRLRDEFPLLAQKFRVATKQNGLRVAQLNAIEQSLLMPVEQSILLKPTHWEFLLQEILNICNQKYSGVEFNSNPVFYDLALKITKMFFQDDPNIKKTLILAGPSVFSHPNASSLLSSLDQISNLLGSKLAFLPSGGNVCGGYLARALPTSDGYSAASMFDNSDASFLLLNVEPAKDLDFGNKAVKTMKNSSQGVVAMTCFKSAVSELADVMLPISAFTESAGTFINIEGRAQNIRPVTGLQGSSRPAWKVLRVIGNLLGIDEFHFENINEVNKVFLEKINNYGFINELNFSVNKSSNNTFKTLSDKNIIEFVPYFPIYLTDSIVRRSQPLLKTSQSKKPNFLIHPKTMHALKIKNGDIVNLEIENSSENTFMKAHCFEDHSVAVGVVALAHGHPDQDNFGSPNQLVNIVFD